MHGRGQALLQLRSDVMFDALRRRVQVVERQVEVLDQKGLPQPMRSNQRPRAFAPEIRELDALARHDANFTAPPDRRHCQPGRRSASLCRCGTL